ncbi:RagB/SusD family nutrient uptake outer membrane protein [Chitinophaga silvatica]|uniref:RagB/SusD family nutrient uptake outer membrane protein n=1 Tax=Chitinophaga silvatica TaxID=2282649 RepID=A0A3E1YB80_9BACT|nr:RagB/SusD family nutrient uptake outer membrane protein [Chitinophaga silvatica]RFS23278.1 RagB/SusD family nutrient uptake outer membrane protein [Chitinophaga silvatica]
MKLFKNYIGICLLAAASFGLPACNKKLDVIPGGQIVPNQIKSQGDVEAVIKGIYSNLQDPNAFGERNLLMADLLGDEGEISFEGTFLNYRLVQEKNQDKNSSIVEGMWQRSYYTINNANLVLENLDKVSKDSKEAFEAEARFLRGLVYFNLCNFYAKPYSAGNVTSTLAVPLILKATIGQENLKDSYQGRATLDAVHKQILEDLLFAAEKLPEYIGNGRADKYVASAILSRVYLSEGKYEEAATAANEVIESGEYALTSSYSKAFNNASNSTEDVFAIQQTNQSNSGTTNNGLTTFYGGYDYGSRGDIIIDLDALPVTFEANDERGNFFYENYGINVDDGMYTTKWRDQYKVIPIVRLAELYLTRAEANFRAGTTIGADPIDDVNEVRHRSGASVLNKITVDDIVEERVRELLFEGDKIWTYKRLKKDFGSLSYLYDKLIFPIPQREIDVNTKLKDQQNPGY